MWPRTVGGASLRVANAAESTTPVHEVRGGDQRYQLGCREVFGMANIIMSHRGDRWGSAARQISVLLPLLAYYLVVVVIASSSAFMGDDGGYVYNATRMVHGPAVSPQDLRLWWGPGYPFVLVPFVVFGLPWIAAKLLNALFLFGAILYFYALLRRYIAGSTVASARRLSVSGIPGSNESLLWVCHCCCLGVLIGFAGLATTAHRPSRHPGFPARIDLVRSVPLVHVLFNGSAVLLGNFWWHVSLLDVLTASK